MDQREAILLHFGYGFPIVCFFPHRPASCPKAGTARLRPGQLSFLCACKMHQTKFADGLRWLVHFGMPMDKTNLIIVHIVLISSRFFVRNPSNILRSVRAFHPVVSRAFTVHLTREANLNDLRLLDFNVAKRLTEGGTGWHGGFLR